MLENRVGKAGLLWGCNGVPLSILAHIINFQINLILWQRNKYELPSHTTSTCEFFFTATPARWASSSALIWRTIGSSCRLKLPGISAAQTSWEVPHVCSWVLNGLSDLYFLMLLSLCNPMGNMWPNLDAMLQQVTSWICGDSAWEFPIRSWEGCWSPMGNGFGL